MITQMCCFLKNFYGCSRWSVEGREPKELAQQIQTTKVATVQEKALGARAGAHQTMAVFFIIRLDSVGSWMSLWRD